MSQTHIDLKNIGMRFRLQNEKAFTLKETLVNWVRHKNGFHEFWALKNVSLEVNPGDAVAIIGRNGSGKSTLLKIIAGVFDPTEGYRQVNGSIGALIELGAGFNGELTGRENVFLSGAIMGLSKKEMQKRYDQIVDFAELREFMDTPVKNYSSGMYARLGFALATDVDADILLIDEILGVGDEAFREKSYGRIEAHLKSGKTVVFVSHDADSVQKLCSKAILLQNGVVHYAGPTAKALAAYRSLLG
jgi:ABC-type polysaccharide/polyol phosphate transport system ATPase subunit